jgi:hypothetical protein
MGWFIESPEEVLIGLKEGRIQAQAFREDEFGRRRCSPEYFLNPSGKGLVPIGPKWVRRQEVRSVTEATLSAGSVSVTVRRGKRETVWYAVDERGETICDLQTYLMNTDPHYAMAVLELEKRKR